MYVHVKYTTSQLQTLCSSEVLFQQKQRCLCGRCKFFAAKYLGQFNSILDNQTDNYKLANRERTASPVLVASI